MGKPRRLCRQSAGTYGNAGYNSLVGPGFSDLDADLTKLFQIRERHRFELHKAPAILEFCNLR